MICILGVSAETNSESFENGVEFVIVLVRLSYGPIASILKIYVCLWAFKCQ